MNGSNPDSAPTIWLCESAGAGSTSQPGWMSVYEQQRLGGLTGLSRDEFLASRWLIRRGLAFASGHSAHHCRPADGRARESAEPPGWKLSISHSQGLAGCAISKQGAIGLDLEPLSRRPQWRKVTARWFSPDEQAWLDTANSTEAFLKVWTLKEAWLKATGRGIADNLQTLNVSREFSLQGDRPGEQWQASLGRADGFLVAAVYQGDHRPDGHVISGPINFSEPDAAAPEAMTVDGTIDWLFHQPIGYLSDHQA